MTTATYLIALGSNRAGRHGRPADQVRAATAALAAVAVSRIIDTAPLGPSRRRFANAAALVETGETPPALLARLKAMEAAWGRRPGRRWGARALDLDIVLWSGGRWRSPGLAVPHPAFRSRAFVLVPAASIAPGWREPVTGLTLRQLLHRLTARRPVPRSRPRAGL